jgi:RNase H-like domain found in reverse transcriptase
VISVADWEARWWHEQRVAFRKLRSVLADPLFLGPARPDTKKRLCTDATKYGVGIALLQWEKEEKGWLPIGFTSRKLKGAEPPYTSTEKENLAIAFGLRKFRQHLYGEKVEVITDHIALTWLLALTDPKEGLARWIVEMQTFDFVVLYERGDGALMVVPDALSRDTMKKSVVLCHRCLEAVQDMSAGGECAEGRDVLSVEEMLAAQAEAYGDVSALLKDEDCIRDEERLLCKVFGKI